jgi:hypothetical protein
MLQHTYAVWFGGQWVLVQKDKAEERLKVGGYWRLLIIVTSYTWL